MLSFRNETVAPRLRLGNDAFHEIRDGRLDGCRATESKLRRLRNDAEQEESLREPPDEVRSSQEIGDADLVHRETLHRGERHVSAFQPDRASGRTVGANGVDENRVPRVRDVGQERQAQGAAVEHDRVGRRFVPFAEEIHGGDSRPVVAAEHIPETENQEASAFSHAFSGNAPHATPAP